MRLRVSMAENKKLMYEILKSVTALITAAFGFVAALAWNGAISAFFVDVFGTQKTLMPELGYAVVVTIIAVVVTVYLAKVTASMASK